jgi:hypothetical protein
MMDKVQKPSNPKCYTTARTLLNLLISKRSHAESEMYYSVQKHVHLARVCKSFHAVIKSNCTFCATSLTD